MRRCGELGDPDNGDQTRLSAMVESRRMFDRIRLMRMAAAVERCHCKPHVLRYSNGHHSHDVLTLVIQTWKQAHDGALPRAELMAAAHVHDHAEIVTGDVPSPIKDMLGERLVAVDSNVEHWLDIAPELTDEERFYLHAADRFELWLWGWEEAARGNGTVKDWFETTEQRWRDNPPPWPFMDLMEEVLAHEGVPHLTRAQLNEAGGLQ